MEELLNEYEILINIVAVLLVFGSMIIFAVLDDIGINVLNPLCVLGIPIVGIWSAISEPNDTGFNIIGSLFIRLMIILFIIMISIIFLPCVITAQVFWSTMYGVALAIKFIFTFKIETLTNKFKKKKKNIDIDQLIDPEWFINVRRDIWTKDN